MKLKLCTALLTAVSLFAAMSVAAQKTPESIAQKSAAMENFGKLPLSFEPTADASRFVAHSGGYSVAVEAREALVVVNDAKSGVSKALRMGFANATTGGALEPLDPQKSVTHYYIGNDPAKWRLGVKNYSKVRAAGVYPGIDVVYYGDHRHLEFDFDVAPKADPSAIALSFSGMDKLSKDASGDLVAEVNGRAVRLAKPFAYQRVAGVNKAVAVEYELASAGSVHLRLGQYDANSELIIDPVVSYATYLGGTANDTANGIAVDSSGNAYVTGQTCSPVFPLNAGNTNLLGSCDAFVTEYSAAGANPVTAIIGGTNPSNATASGNAIALDSSNQVYIIGTTNFQNIPLNVGGYRNAWQGGDTDAFIAILTTSGGLALSRTSYLGGSGADAGFGIAVDTSKNVIAVGRTCSWDFPVYNAIEEKVEFCVAFITKLDNGLHIAPPIGSDASAFSPPPAPPAGAKYYFSGYFAGQPVPPNVTAVWAPKTTYDPGAIVFDNTAPTPNVQITYGGGTSGTIAPTWQTTKLNVTYDGTIAWVNLGPTATPLYATTEAYGVALDPPGDVFIAGGTNTADLESTPPYLYSYYHGTGAWVLKLSGSTGAFVYGTALETTATDATATVDAARAIAVDTQGRAYVTGTVTGSLIGTNSSSYKSSGSGEQDAFVVRMDPSGGAISYATYLGGSGNDQGLGIAVDNSGAAYVTGSTQSSNFPIINPLTNPNSEPNPYTPIVSLSGAQDAFISKFTSDGSALVFSAYLGGSDTDTGNAIALDTGNQGNMYVAGTTYSADFEQLDPSTYTAPQLNYGGGGDAFVAMVAGASLPIVTVTPGSLSFGTLNVGTASAPYAVKYLNTNDTSTVTIGNITFGGTNSGDFTQSFPGTSPGDCVGGGVVAPGTYCNVWVTFTPAAGGPRSATLTITDGTSSTAHVINLAGTGAVPLVSFTPTSLTFGPQLVNTSSSALPIVLQDTGQGVLNVGTVAISSTATGDHPEDFSIQSNSCSAPLTSGSSCTINIVFKPSGLGTRNATLVVADNVTGSPQHLALTGSATAIANTITPTSLTFSQQSLNTTSATQTVSVQNTDTQTLIITGATITANFKIAANNCTGSVAPNQTCTILVAFDPTVVGALTGTLTISGNGSGMPAAVSLSGTGASGAQSGSITLSPTSLTFTQQQGGTSADQSVTLANGSSSTSLTVTGMSIDNAHFGIDSTTCGTTPFTLAASGSCTIKVNYSPVVIGTESGNLTVSSSSASGAVALSGTGTSTSSSTPDFTLTPNVTGVSVVQGGTATFIISVAPVNGFNSNLGFTCTATAGTCSVTPTTTTMDGTNVKSIQLSVGTAGVTGASARLRMGSRPIFFALFPFTMMGMLLINKRCSKWVVLMLLCLCVAMGMVGCGASNSSTSSSGLPTTIGVTFTATSTGTPVVTHSLSGNSVLSVVVTAK